MLGTGSSTARTSVTCQRWCRVEIQILDAGGHKQVWAPPPAGARCLPQQVCPRIKSNLYKKAQLIENMLTKIKTLRHGNQWQKTEHWKELGSLPFSLTLLRLRLSFLYYKFVLNLWYPGRFLPSLCSPQNVLPFQAMAGWTSPCQQNAS